MHKDFDRWNKVKKEIVKYSKNKIRLGFINGNKNYLILDQLKMVDTKRIEDKIEIINNDISIKATKAVLDFLDSFRNTP